MRLGDLRGKALVRVFPWFEAFGFFIRLDENVFFLCERPNDRRFSIEALYSFDDIACSFAFSDNEKTAKG